MDNQKQSLATQGQDPQNPQPNVSMTSPAPTSFVGSPQQTFTPGGSANQPRVGLPGSSTQGPVVMYGINDSYKVSGSRHLRWGVIAAGISFLTLLVGISLYIWILPTMWANAYLRNTGPLYHQQVAQIVSVYQSIGRPVFTSNNSSPTADSQDLAYIGAIIQSAITNTNALKAKDHLIVLPGTTWLHSVSQANTEYQAMQQYVSDSQTFLQDYKSLVVYAQQIEQIGQVQLPPLLNDFYSVGASTGSKAALIAALQKTTNDLQSFTDQVKGLKPSDDLKQFNEDLLTDLSSMNNGLQGLLSALQSGVGSNVANSLATFQSAINSFSTLLSSNATANLQTTSTIHSQITTLQGERPLQ